MTLLTEERACDVPASGAEILDEAHGCLLRFVAPSSAAAADVLTLFEMHTHCVDGENKLLSDSTPRIAVVSDEPDSGKTRHLEVCGALCRRAELVADVTGPALTGMVTDGSTLIIDELDLVLGSGDSARSIRTFLNSGYRRSGATRRAKGKISTFAPVMLGGLHSVFTRNPLLRPTYGRAIVIFAKPNRGRVPIEPWRERLHVPVATGIAEAMSGWARSKTVELITTYPDLPDGCVDRLADKWEPLFIVAAVAGGDWPERVRAAYEELGTSSGTSEPALPPGLQLIADVRTVWPDDRDSVTTVDLQRLLLDMEGSTWPSTWPDAGSIPREMAALLRPYDIGPCKLRLSASATAQGYRLSDFEEVDVPGVPSVPDVPDMDTPPF